MPRGWRSGSVYWVNEQLNRDEVEYLSLARSLTHTFTATIYDEHVRKGPVEPFGRAPGYPVFLALVGAGREFAERRSRLRQDRAVDRRRYRRVSHWMGSVAHGWRASRHGRCGDRRGLSPAVWISGYVYSEAVFWPIAIALALVFNRTLAQPRATMWKSAVLFGVVTGLAVLVRAATGPFVPLAGLWLLWKRQFAAAAGFAVGLAIVLTPWTIRNYEHHGRLVLVASDGGVTFWTGNNALATGEGDMAANPHLKYANQELRARYPGLTEEQIGARSTTASPWRGFAQTPATGSGSW